MTSLNENKPKQQSNSNDQVLGFGHDEVALLTKNGYTSIHYEGITSNTHLIKDTNSFLLGYECGRAFERRFFENENQKELLEKSSSSRD